MATQTGKFVNADQNVEQAFAQILRSNLAAARDAEPIVLAGEDPEGIHQMRVCLRRMCSALVVFDSLGQQPAGAKVCFPEVPCHVERLTPLGRPVLR